MNRYQRALQKKLQWLADQRNLSQTNLTLLLKMQQKDAVIEKKDAALRQAKAMLREAGLSEEEIEKRLG